MEIRTSPKFERQYKKLSLDIKLRAEAKEKIFVSDPFDPRLNTHKLHGKDREHWAFGVTRKIRIKFSFLGDNEVLYLEVGSHDDVY